jgi:hypothetical protein
LLARARKSRPVFLPLKTAPPENGGTAFHVNRRCRHNTLDFALQNRVPKVAAAPLWNPPQSRQKVMHRDETVHILIVCSTPYPLPQAYVRYAPMSSVKMNAEAHLTLAHI